MANPRELFAGVDIGATSVKAGIVTAEGRIVAREQEALRPKEHEPADVVALTARIVGRALKTVRPSVSLSCAIPGVTMY